MLSPIHSHQQTATKTARCQQLLSEDLNHGPDYDGAVVIP